MSKDQRDKMNEIDEEIYEGFVSSCSNQGRYERAKERQEWNWISYVFLGGIFIFFLTLIIFNIGFIQLLSWLFYIVSLHFLIKQIINCREGNPFTKQFSTGINDVCDNDPEMANAMCDTDQDDPVEEEGGDTSAKSQVKKDVPTLNRERERRKHLSKLNQQYETCIENDNDPWDDDSALK